MRKPKKIVISPAKKGTYTARAKSNHHTVVQQARIDTGNHSKASAAVKKQAQFALNARKFNH